MSTDVSSNIEDELNITTLPLEVLYSIVDKLDAIPILSFRQTCLTLYDILSSDRFWFTRYRQDITAETKVEEIDWFQKYWNDLPLPVYNLGVNLLVPYHKESPSLTPQILTQHRAKNIACGGQHGFFIDVDDYLWGYGVNSNGQLGTKGSFSVPIRLPFKVKQIACGHVHTVVIDVNHNLWAFGYNRWGQLGLGDTHDRWQPEFVGIKAKRVACGSNHTVIIDMENWIRASGENSHGQLGLGTEESQIYFHWLNLQGRHIICGFCHTIIIGLNFHVYGFGLNSHGELGIPSLEGFYQNVLSPTPIYWPHKHINMNTDGSIDINKPIPILAKSGASTGWATLLIDMNDELIVFGSNQWGELGLNVSDRSILPVRDIRYKVKYIACGGWYTLIIDKKNNLWIYGSNQSILGDSKGPVQIPGIRARQVACGDFHVVIRGYVHHSDKT